MKKLIFAIALPAICSSLLTSCTGPTKEEVQKIKSWDILAGKNDSSHLVSRKSFPVEHGLAAGCVALYKKQYEKDIDTNLIKKAFSTGVSFGSSDLSTWLFYISQNVNYNEIRVCFGVYTHEYVTKYPAVAAKEGRTTIFLWPYNNGQPGTYRTGGTIGGGNNTTITAGPGDLSDPYNLGDVYP